METVIKEKIVTITPHISDPATNLIDGEWVASDDSFPVLDPATLDELGTAADASCAQSLAALSAASSAFPSWRNTPAEERGMYLRHAAVEIRRAIETLSLLLSFESGKPLAEARGEWIGSARMLEWAAEQGRRVDGRIVPSGPNDPGMVRLVPVGVALAITPWNFPAVIVARKLGMALAAGVPLILKPAELTPFTAVAMARILNDAGLPKGVLNVLTSANPGPIVDVLMRDPRLRKLSFTGSTDVGRMLARSCSERLRRFSLELGGHAPAIVFPDADLAEAADAIMRAKFANAGQACTAINRLYVHRDVHDELVRLLLDRVAALQIGHGCDLGVTLGPLIEMAGMDKVHRHVTDATERGAVIATGGHAWSGPDARLRGAFYEPTVLTDVPADAVINREETFGPVLPVSVFETESDVIERANSTEFGLTAYVFAASMKRIWTVVDNLDFGVIAVNEGAPIRPELPFGGTKQSGQEREGGSEGMDAYLEPKAISIRL